MTTLRDVSCLQKILYVSLEKSASVYITIKVQFKSDWYPQIYRNVDYRANNRQLYIKLN